jgi:hypothetical protein
LARCDDEPVVVVPATGDARLDTLELGGRPRASAYLGEGSAPFAVSLAVPPAGDDRQRLAAVTLFGEGTVAIVDPCSGGILGRTDPIDEDVAVARTPQAVAFDLDGARLLVTFTNVQQVSRGPQEPPVLGPGVLAAFDVADPRAPVLERAIDVGCENPQGLALDDRGDPWVSCSGAIGVDVDGLQAALGDGALLHLDRETLAVVHRIDAGRFAPGTPLLRADRVAVGSLVRGRVAIVDADAPSLDDATILSLPGEPSIEDAERVDSVFRIAAFPVGTSRSGEGPADDDVAYAPLFSADRLFPFSLSTAALIDDEGIAVGPGGEGFRGVLTVALERGVAPGVDGVALLALSAEVVPFAVPASKKKIGGGQ